MPAWYARRALLRAAVFDTRDHELWAHRPAVAASVATGVITEVREDTVVLDGRRGTEFFTVSPATVTWLGRAHRAVRAASRRHGHHQAPGGGRRRAPAPPARRAHLGPHRPGDRHDHRRRRAASSWSTPAAMTARRGSVVIAARPPRPDPGALPQAGARLPARRHRHPARRPPARGGASHRPAALPGGPRARRRRWSAGPCPHPVSGSAVWHEPDDEPPGLLGLGYPALDPETAVRPPTAARAASGCRTCRSAARCGSRNECADRSAVLPVTSDGAMARQFCDRCVKCGTSPKGRVADLTMAAFVELGGNLEDGCFNATMTLAG